MKQTNNAIKFLMAQYRAIFKNAYFKGMASAVLLTAGLAAGAAQATTTDGVLEESDFNKDSGSVATVTITTNSNIDMGKLGDVFTGTNTFIGVNSSINGAAVTIKGEANRAIVAQGGGTFTVKNGGSLTITNGNNLTATLVLLRLLVKTLKLISPPLASTLTKSRSQTVLL